MYRIDNATATASLPAPSAPGPNPDGFFTPGDPLSGTQATILDAEWANMVQEEIANAVESAGLGLDKADRSQLAQAVALLVAAASVSLHTDTGGGANVYAITPSPAMAAYAAGQTFAVKIRTGGNNTGACTLDVNGLGAKSIKLAGGGDPGADQIVAGAVMRVQYDGTQFRLLNPNLQKMANVTRYATAGTFTYTVPDGVHWLDVEVWGAGGGGAWADGITGYAAGGGGGYARKLCAVTPGQQVTVTVGAGGNGGSSGSGSDGGSSSFGAFCSATGGKGGVSQGGNQSTNGGDGGSGSGGDINLTGGKGMGNAQSAGGDAPLGGAGGVFSYNGTTFSSGPGQAPGGGGSSIQYSSGAGRPGGAGGAGEVRIRY